MERYRFMSLNRNRQLRMLKLNGRILHRKIKRSYTVCIYQLENFYIETWEGPEEGSVENLVLFKDRTLLNFPFNQGRKA